MSDNEVELTKGAGSDADAGSGTTTEEVPQPAAGYINRAWLLVPLGLLSILTWLGWIYCRSIQDSVIDGCLTNFSHVPQNSDHEFYHCYMSGGTAFVILFACWAVTALAGVRFVWMLLRQVVEGPSPETSAQMLERLRNRAGALGGLSFTVVVVLSMVLGAMHVYGTDPLSQLSTWLFAG